jgi:integrase
MKLWPKAIPRPMRFHDRRGTTATLLARSGVGLVLAQRILRHSDLQAGIDRIGIPDPQRRGRSRPWRS